jgi:hypothetical protein
MSDIQLVDTDHTLIEGAAWFTVGSFRIRIYTITKGVKIEVYPINKVVDGMLASLVVGEPSLVEDAVALECAENKGFIKGLETAKRDIAKKLGLA